MIIIHKYYQQHPVYCLGKSNVPGVQNVTTADSSSRQNYKSKNTEAVLRTARLVTKLKLHGNVTCLLDKRMMMIP